MNDENTNIGNGSAIPPEDIFAQRRAKVVELLEAGTAPFGEAFPDTTAIADVRAASDPEPKDGFSARIAGRLRSFRVMGKSIFADVQDSSGRIQIYAKKNEIGDDRFNQFKKLDVGDIIGVEGTLFVTKKGELTLKIAEFALLSKSLRPLPEKWHGLTDIEQRYRQRYLDLIVNSESRDVFLKRFTIIREIRAFLESKGR